MDTFCRTLAIVLFCVAAAGTLAGNDTLASGALSLDEMAVVHGGTSTRCRNWECGGPARDCTGVGEGHYCNSANPDYQCTDRVVITELVLACNSTDPGLPLCIDGEKTYCGTTNACECDDLISHLCTSSYYGTSGWYNPCENP